jgi:hypothetical protein
VWRLGRARIGMRWHVATTRGIMVLGFSRHASCATRRYRQLSRKKVEEGVDRQVGQAPDGHEDTPGGGRSGPFAILQFCCQGTRTGRVRNRPVRAAKRARRHTRLFRPCAPAPWGCVWPLYCRWRTLGVPVTPHWRLPDRRAVTARCQEYDIGLRRRTANAWREEVWPRLTCLKSRDLFLTHGGVTETPSAPNCVRRALRCARRPRRKCVTA